MKRLGIVIITFLTVFSLAGTATADEYSASEDSVRRGILIGFGIQGGHIRFECVDCDGSLNEAAGANFQLAFMLNRKLALSGDIWAMVHSTETVGITSTASQVIATIGPQFWLLPRVWLRLGLGAARSKIEIGNLQAESESVLGISGAIGFEILTSRRFALDVQGRVGTGFYDGIDAVNAGIGLGFTWF